MRISHHRAWVVRLLGRVNPALAQNPASVERVQTGVEPIQETHVAELGLLVIDVAGADDETVFAFQNAVAQRWATATSECTTRDPGQPGVRLRLYADLRQALPRPAADGAESSSAR
ncbi:DUF6207 family protein [Streptomyces spiralis]